MNNTKLVLSEFFEPTIDNLNNWLKNVSWSVVKGKYDHELILRDSHQRDRGVIDSRATVGEIMKDLLKSKDQLK